MFLTWFKVEIFYNKTVISIFPGKAGFQAGNN